MVSKQPGAGGSGSGKGKQPASPSPSPPPHTERGLSELRLGVEFVLAWIIAAESGDLCQCGRARVSDIDLIARLSDAVTGMSLTEQPVMVGHDGADDSDGSEQTDTAEYAGPATGPAPVIAAPVPAPAPVPVPAAAPAPLAAPAPPAAPPVAVAAAAPVPAAAPAAAPVHQFGFVPNPAGPGVAPQLTIPDNLLDLYHGFRHSPGINPPRPAHPTDTGSFYVVTVGRLVGVYCDWTAVAPAVIGVPGAIHKKYSTFSAAWTAWRLAYDSGRVRLV